MTELTAHEWRPSPKMLEIMERGGHIPPADPEENQLMVDCARAQRRLEEWRSEAEAASHLPTNAAARKDIPVATGFIDYFPDAIAAVAELSRIGNDQHNPGKPLHWDRSKSGDESDALMRHFLERGQIDTDGVRHSTKVAWRALAMLQKELEASR